MIKRLTACVLVFAAMVSLAGCWNYKGLDQLSIVVGIAVDYDKENRLYNMSCEVVDLTGTNKEATIKSKIIMSSGPTLFEAARNAKKKEADKLFFGSAQVLILSLDLVKEIGVLDVVEWFLRDGECRESMCVAISKEKTAAEILLSSETMNGMMSQILWDIIMEDNEVTATAPHIELFQIYNDLNTPVHIITIPTLRRVSQSGSDISELDGSVIMHHNTFRGIMPSELGMYLLMLQDELKGGLLTVRLSDEPTDLVTLEVFENISKTDYKRDGDTLTFTVNVLTFMAAMENQAAADLSDRGTTAYIEELAGRKIEENIHTLVSLAQQEYKSDIMKFGEIVYKRDYKYWQENGERWDEIFPTVQVNVSARVFIRNSGFLK